MSNITPLSQAWKDALDDYSTYLSLEGKSATAIGFQVRQVRRLCVDFPDKTLENLTSTLVETWCKANLCRSINARRELYTCVRRFLLWAYTENLSETNLSLSVPSVYDPHRPRQYMKRKETPTQWQEPVSSFLEFLQAQGLSVSTLRLRRQQIENLARSFPDTAPYDVSFSELVSWSAGLGVSSSTRRSIHSAIREFYRWAQGMGYVTESPAHKLPKVKDKKALPRPLPDDAYINAMRNGNAQQRLILRLAAEAGLRRSEIAALHTKNLVLLQDGFILHIVGKGNKERVIPLSKDLADSLNSLPSGWVFPSKDTSKHLGADKIANMVKDLLQPTYTLHTLRHRFATHAYTLTRDLYAVQSLMGHSSADTTRRYVSLDTASLREAIEKVSEANKSIL